MANPGKAMVVSIDKATARMYDKVKKYWDQHLAAREAQLKFAAEDERDALSARLDELRRTDLAVVVSPAQNEVEDFKRKGLDILPHRRRMVQEDLEKKFKDANDPFQIVFVCAMWMTGFDVPSCSTIYLDKPMRNHTLMQTIARANRVFPEKTNGLIVDYVGVFRDLKRALAVYGSDPGGALGVGDLPVLAKSDLITALRRAIDEATAYCRGQGADLARVELAAGYEKIRLLDDAVEAVAGGDDAKRRFLSLADEVEKLFRAILPDFAANEFSGRRAVLTRMAQKIRIEMPPVDVSQVLESVEELLDASVGTEGYVIEGALREAGGAAPAAKLIDLGQINFEALQRQFERGRKRTEAERLRTLLSIKVTRLVRLNRTRLNYPERLQALIDQYNSDAANVESFFRELGEFAKQLDEEEKRHLTEQLSEEELAVFDLLTKPAIELTEAEERKIKTLARDLLGALKAGKLVLDWRKRQQTRAAVRLAIEETLEQLPIAYTSQLYREKCEAVYQHVYESYFGPGQSVFALAS